MTEYSEAFRNRMVERMSGLRAKSASSLSKAVGVPLPTLSKWLRDAATLASVSKKKARPKKSGTATVIRPGTWPTTRERAPHRAPPAPR